MDSCSWIAFLGGWNVQQAVSCRDTSRNISLIQWHPEKPRITSQYDYAHSHWSANCKRLCKLFYISLFTLLQPSTDFWWSRLSTICEMCNVCHVYIPSLHEPFHLSWNQWMAGSLGVYPALQDSLTAIRVQSPGTTKEFGFSAKAAEIDIWCPIDEGWISIWSSTHDSHNHATLKVFSKNASLRRPVMESEQWNALRNKTYSWPIATLLWWSFIASFGACGSKLGGGINIGD